MVRELVGRIKPSPEGDGRRPGLEAAGRGGRGSGRGLALRAPCRTGGAGAAGDERTGNGGRGQ